MNEATPLLSDPISICEIPTDRSSRKTFDRIRFRAYILTINKDGILKLRRVAVSRLCFATFGSSETVTPPTWKVRKYASDCACGYSRRPRRFRRGPGESAALRWMNIQWEEG